jgi:hypothetical protein
MPILGLSCPWGLPWLFSPLGGFYRPEINGEFRVLLHASKNNVSFLRIKKNL